MRHAGPESRRSPRFALLGGQADIALQIGSQKYAANGRASAWSTLRASIYNVPARFYSVSHLRRLRTGSTRRCGGRPTASPTCCRSALPAAGRATASTTSREKKGSGGARLDGRTIVVDVVAASGEKISGKSKVPRFGGIQCGVWLMKPVVVLSSLAAGQPQRHRRNARSNTSAPTTSGRRLAGLDGQSRPRRSTEAGRNQDLHTDWKDEKRRNDGNNATEPRAVCAIPVRFLCSRR